MKMTGLKKRGLHPELLTSQGKDSYHIEILKSKRGATVQVSGVIGVGELSGECISLISHNGRLTVSGSGLTLGILGRGVAEVYGRIEGVAFSYGKN